VLSLTLTRYCSSEESVFFRVLVNRVFLLRLTLAAHRNWCGVVSGDVAMLNSPGCNTCMGPLQPEDGHELCPSCLGLEHLELLEDPCMNCTIMRRAVRAARLAKVELMDDAGLPLSEQLIPARPTDSKRWVKEAASAPSKKVKPDKLSSRVDLLAAELAEMKSLLLALHSGAVRAAPNPPIARLAAEGNMVSMAASDTHFNEYSEGDPSHASVASSRSSARGALDGEEDGLMGAVIRTALAHLQLDVQQSVNTG